MRWCTYVLLGCLAVSSANAEIAVTLRGQLGGNCQVVAVPEDGSFACLGVGPRVVLLETSASGEVQETGQSEVLPEVVEGIALDGEYAFVADGTAGLYALEITDRAAPRVAAHYETPAEPTWDRGLRACVSGSLLYFADGSAGLQILDVSDPAAPAWVASVADIAAYDVAVSDGYAYVASSDQGLRVLDVSDPVHPKAIALLDLSCRVREIRFSEGYVYAIGYSFAPGAFGGMCAIDVRDPSKPVLAGSYAMDSPRKLSIDGKIAYVADSWQGVDFIRIANPAFPSRIGGYRGAGYALGVAAAPGRLYVAAEYAGLDVVDVSTLTEPVRTGTYASMNVNEVAVLGSYAYVTGSYNGLSVIDVNDPSSPRWVSRLGVDYEGVLAVDKRYVWLAGGGRLRAFKMSNPANPKLIGSCEIDTGAWDLAVQDSHACVAGGEGVTLVDISRASIPTVVGRCTTPVGTWGVCFSGKYVYAAGFKGLYVIDISNPAAPVVIGHYSEPTSWPNDVAIYNDYAYLAGGSAGIQAIDLFDPWLPGKVREYDTSQAANVVVQGCYAYLTDSQAGLHVIDVSNPLSLACVGRCENAGHQKLAVAGNYVYTADNIKGLGIIEIADPNDSE